ncbi:MAG: helicase [Candidatus Woesearchaeota archaeon]|jgi:helicase
MDTELALLKEKIPQRIYNELESQGFNALRPSQTKAIQKGLFDHNNLLICTPTASGKTLVGELAILQSILIDKKKAIYIVPLKALANEKYKDFKKKYEGTCKIALSIGDTDSAESYLGEYDIIITTSEKLDSLMRHHTPWISEVGCVVVDEIHQLNDSRRGPTLEIVITILRSVLTKIQLIGLSATIGNPKELAEWLGANLVEDSWRPTELKEGIYVDNKIHFSKQLVKESTNTE